MRERGCHDEPLLVDGAGEGEIVATYDGGKGQIKFV